MINRVSVNALLKAVIASLAAAVVIALSLSAWSARGRVASANRIAAVAEASSDLFTALHNLRVDRATTFRQMNAEAQVAAVPPALQKVRNGELPALRAGVKALAATNFPDRQSAVAGLGQAITKLDSLQRETAAAFAKPKAARPQGLAKAYNDETTALMHLLDHISMQLTKSVQFEDSYVDQLLEVKQLAWVARNAAGDVSVIISNGLSGLPLPPDPMIKYTANVAKVEAVWAALEDIASRLPTSPRFVATLSKAKADFFAPEFTQLRDKTLKQLIAKEKPGIALKDWSPLTVGKLALLLSVAEASLDSIKEYAAAQHASALWKLWSELGLLALALSLVAGMMMLVSRRVTGPLRQIRQGMLKVAAGDFSVMLPGLERKDEIGDVANAVERFKVLADEKARAEAEEATQRQKTEAGRQAQLAQAEAAAQTKVAEERTKAAEEQMHAVKALGVGLRKLSDGDLTFRLSGHFPDAYQELKEDFNSTMGRLQDTIKSLVSSTREVSNASAEISTSTTDLSQRTEEQAASLEETSASLEQIAATVKKNAENAQQANRSTSSTRQVADRGGQVVSQAVDAMAKIEDSSRKISDIIGVIDEIARQTNLLALNAAVEAARAGEAGRGFAVVASEVRSLAQRSSQAAKDIKDLITNSNGQVKDGVDLVNRAGTALAEIVESIKSVAEIVSDIASASAEQATGIEHVNKALNQMDEVTQQNSALVEENAATAKTLEQQAMAMNDRVAFFHVDDAADGELAGRSGAIPEQQSAVTAPKQQPAMAPRRVAAAG